jgi:hypothetical protein
MSRFGRLRAIKAKSNLGLVNRDYSTDTELTPSISLKGTQWQRFEHHIELLNKRSTPDEHYKLLIMGRHGEGEHNVAEAKYGTEAWDVCMQKAPVDCPLSDRRM